MSNGDNFKSTILGRPLFVLSKTIRLRKKYGTRLGEAGFNAYDIAKLMGHANISTSQRYVRNLPVGAGEAVMLKNQRGHNTVTSEAKIGLALV